MPHDLSLFSGERQTATDYMAIRADHRFRYEWADGKIASDTFGVDAFCGIGYGTWLLSQSRFVLGIDGSPEAITAANLNFRRLTNLFSASYFPFELPPEKFDFVVALESIEHVRDGAAFYRTLCRALKPGGRLIFSTPCEELLPHRVMGNHFHYQHYTLNETSDLAQANGMELLSFAGQDTYQMTAEGSPDGLLLEEQMQLKDSEPGQFIIVDARKARAA